MNWPPLQGRSSDVLAEVLRNAVHTKPKDLLEYVAQALQDQSGLDPAEFEQFFEECKRKPRTYVLEDRCPTGQEPMAWVPMRFNDDTILSVLQAKLNELTSEILSVISVDDTKAFLDRACVAMPELMYVRAKPSEPVVDQSNFIGAELAIFQALRGVYLCFTGCEPPALDDEMVEFSFLCEALVTDTRTQLRDFSFDAAGLETLIVFLMVRTLGSHEPFQRRFGAGNTDASKAVLHAIEHDARALPSYYRLGAPQQQLIKACLQVWFPLDMLYSTEAAPGHFMNAKELLSPIEGGLAFYICALAVDNVVSRRSSVMSDEVVDLIRLSALSLTNLEKSSAGRAYETLLKRRAENHGWRLVRDDALSKAVTRICCFIGQEDTDYWNEVQNVVDELQPTEKEVLKRELALKDGISETPAYVLLGVGRFLDAAVNNPAIGLQSAVTFLARLLGDAARNFDKLASRTNRMVDVDLGSASRRAREFSGGLPFEDLPFQLRETVSRVIAVDLAGS